MIFLTGDVHHDSMRGRDQRYLGRHDSEGSLAVRYADVAARYGLKVTLFVSGRLCVENPALVRELAQRDNVRIGAHTWNCYSPRLLYLLFRMLPFPELGPRFLQEHLIRRTLRTIYGLTNYRPRSWRGHGYKHDVHTYDILDESGVEVVSDYKSETAAIERIGKKLVSLPINLPPDHETIEHPPGEVPPPPRLAGIYRNITGRPIRRSGALAVSEWTNDLLEDVSERVERAGFATFLIHPACQWIADGMKSFERLCSELEPYPSEWTDNAQFLLSQRVHENDFA